MTVFSDALAAIVHVVGSNAIFSVTKFALLLLCVCGIGYYGFAIYSTWTFQQQSIAKNSDFYPAVSILKPLCGADQTTYQSLASFCEQDYPTYQIIFAVQSVADPSVLVVNRLIADFPDVDIQLVIRSSAVVTNPKVNNLMNALPFAKYPLLVISDSDILVKPNYLESVVQPFQDAEVGVVTCIYRSWAKGWVASLEAIGIATSFMANVLAARQLREVTFAIGATIAIRRSVLDEIGGFSAIGDYLADDYQLGFLPSQRGYRVVISRCIVTHMLTYTTLSDLVLRQIRWNQGIRAGDRAGYTGLILTYGSVLSLGFLGLTGGSWEGWSIVILAWIGRLLLAWMIGFKLLEDPATQKRWWLILISDCIFFGIWCAGFMSRTVSWRGQTYQLSQIGTLIAMPAGEQQISQS